MQKHSIASSATVMTVVLNELLQSCSTVLHAKVCTWVHAAWSLCCWLVAVGTLNMPGVLHGIYMTASVLQELEVPNVISCWTGERRQG